jgi:outer membrane protein assembly factor BamB
MHRGSMIKTICATTCLAITSMFSSQLSAGDWPQILGPTRGGIGVKESLVNSWPAKGPKVAWRRKVGAGYSGIVVKDNTAILFHRVGNFEVVEAMNAKTGKNLWTSKHVTNFNSAFNPDKGPRSTPLIHKGNVYVFGSQGVLRCLKMKDGKELWIRRTHQDFNAPEGYFGAGSSPIVASGKLLVNVGSRAGAGIVAFDLLTGKTAWKAVNDTGSYSSPVVTTVNGVEHVVFITRFKLLSINAKTGTVNFSLPFGKRGPTVNGASPVVMNGHVFASAHYGVGAVYLKIEKKAAKVVWKSDELMSSQYMTCIAHEGHLIGIHGQERVNEAVLRCLNPTTKKIAWSKKGLGYGSIIKADGKCLAVSTTGELVMFKADIKGYRELARAQIFQSTTRTLPALANGYLYVRDSGNLKCLDLGKRGK